MLKGEEIVQNKLSGGSGSQAGIEAFAESIPPKNGQVTNFVGHLEGITSDTADVINMLAEKLKPLMRASISSELKSSSEKKDLVPLAADLSRVHNQAQANYNALQYILGRIDL